jgi:hypothetical protein
MSTTWNTLAADVEKLLAQEAIRLHEQGVPFRSVVYGVRHIMKEHNFSTKCLTQRVERALYSYLK